MAEQQTLQPPVSERDHIQSATPGARESHVFHPTVTLVEYGDFECPDCGAAYHIVREVQQRMGNRLRFIFRHYPLPQHSHAEHAAEAAESAGAQGKFWEMHDYLFEHQRTLNDKNLLQAIQTLDLNESRFTSDMEQGIYTSQVEEDIQSGDLSGVEGTPTFFINGVIYNDPYDTQTLLAALEKAGAN